MQDLEMCNNGLDPIDRNSNTVFESFQKDNGLLDLLEIMSGLAMLCDNTLEEKVAFLYDIFDFRRSGEMFEDEVVLLFECVACALSRIGILDEPDDEDIETAAADLFVSMELG